MAYASRPNFSGLHLPDEPFFVDQLKGARSADHSMDNLDLDFTVLDDLEVLVFGDFLRPLNKGSPPI